MSNKIAKRIAIIGAGMSGMTATKACLEQGFDVVVYEKTNYTCGLWRYRENVEPNGIASVMKSTIINSSKEMSAFSDFPPPPEYSNYMHNTKMASYLEMYGDTFAFTKYVKFDHEIVSIEMAENYDVSGQWRIKARLLAESNSEIDEIFDGVMICTGHHGFVNEPTFNGQEQFGGTIMHTHSLKSAKGFDDQNVVVVGIGNSGADAAVEISSVAKQVYLSTRTGSWIFPRVGINGQPVDQFFLRRIMACLFAIFPYKLSCWIIELFLNNVFNHRDYKLAPKHRVLSQHFTLNDALPSRILSGTVQVKGDIEYFVENGVMFKGEVKATPCDTVILATGYRIVFPFISEKLIHIENNQVPLYKWQFIPHIKHAHTIAIIGLVQPIGPQMPVAELQSRWYALLMASKLKLPNAEKMQKDINQKLKFQKRFYCSARHTVQADYVQFMDELAKIVGVYPPILKYFFTDLKLFCALMFGPCVSYQYRLSGPNSWPKAREAILNVHKRTSAALDTNEAYTVKKSKLFFTEFTLIEYFVIFELSLLIFIIIAICLLLLIL